MNYRERTENFRSCRRIGERSYLPVITAAGMIKAVLSLLVVFKVVAVDDVNHQVLNFISDAGFYFLSVFLGASAAR